MTTFLTLAVYKYFDILQRHMCTEYEVQIRNNCITPQGQAILQNLHVEFDLFQYEQQIMKILKPWYNYFIGHPYLEDVLSKFIHLPLQQAAYLL